MATNDIMSYYLQTALLNHILKGTAYTPPTQIYLALYIKEPSQNGGGEEVTGGGYARVACPSFVISASSAVTSTILDFNVATSPWGTVNYMGVKDNSDNLLFFGNLTNPITPIAQNIVRIIPYLSISLSGNETMGWGGNSASPIMNFIFNQVSHPATSSVYLALGRSVTWNSVYNLTGWAEVSSAGYARQRISGSGWDTVVEGQTTLSAPITFTSNAPANWGVISHIALYDQITGGNVILWGKLATSRLVSTGDGIRFLEDSIVVRLHLPSDTT
jgi:hypothetical protein